MFYPKIQTIYKRDMARKLAKSKAPIIEGEYSCEEFPNILNWNITEKVDGTNIRITYEKIEGQVVFGGRTSNAQIPSTLLSYLQKTFTSDMFEKQFPEAYFVVLFGEGYGPKIQNGEYYRDDVSFILFDVFCGGWWLTPHKVQEIASDMGICSVPILHNLPGVDTWECEEIVEFIKSKPRSFIAKQDVEMEGIIATSSPMVLFRNGEPVKFKLKCGDFV